MTSLLSQARNKLPIDVLNIGYIMNNIWGECDSWTLKKAHAFPVFKLMITLAFLSLRANTERCFLLPNYVCDVQAVANCGHVNQPNLDPFKQ